MWGSKLVVAGRLVAAGDSRNHPADSNSGPRSPGTVSLFAVCYLFKIDVILVPMWAKITQSFSSVNLA